MRKIIIFFIILTIIGTVSLVAINLRKDSSHTDDTSEAEISQPIDLSGLDSYQPVSGSVATVTNAGADEKPASQSFTISMNFVGDIMLAGNDTATSSIDAMANSQPSTYFFENVRDYFLMMISQLRIVKMFSPTMTIWRKRIRAKPPHSNNTIMRLRNITLQLHLHNNPERLSAWRSRNIPSVHSGSAPTLQLPSSCRKMASILSRLTTTTLMISAPMATWIRVLP